MIYFNRYFNRLTVSKSSLEKDLRHISVEIAEYDLKNSQVLSPGSILFILSFSY